MKPKNQMSGFEKGVLQLVQDARRRCDSAISGLVEAIRLTKKWKVEIGIGDMAEPLKLLRSAAELIGDRK